MVAVMAAGVAVFASSLFAQETKTTKEGAKARPVVQRGLELFQGVNLTDEQKAKIKPLMESFREANKKWETDNADALKAARAKIQAAREAKDEAAMKAALEDLRKLNETRKPLMEKLIADLKDILTPEQIAKVKANVAAVRAEAAPVRPMAMLERVGATAEQKAKAKAILAAAEQKMKAAETPEAKREILKAAMDDIRNNVLTAEQRAKLEQMRKEAANRPNAGAERPKAAGKN